MFAVNAGDVLLPHAISLPPTSAATIKAVLFMLSAVAQHAVAAAATPEALGPHLHVNAGRPVSYTLLSGAVGALGSALTLSAEANGILTIVASSSDRVEIGFVANNPGDWMFHCHILEHQVHGMMGPVRVT